MLVTVFVWIMWNKSKYDAEKKQNLTKKYHSYLKSTISVNSYKTQSHKTAHETLMFQEKLLPLQTYECWKLIFQQSGDLNFKDFPFGVHHGSMSWRYLTKETVQKLNL